MDALRAFGVLSAYLHQACFKIITRNTGFVFHFRPIIIDGVDGIAQELGNLRTVVYAQTDEGEDTEFGSEQFPFTGHNVLSGL